MSIDTIYKNYFQKSKTFLFPLLGIAKGLLTSPTNTYLSWEGHYTVEDRKLICLYQTIDPAHLIIEKVHLFTHPLFEKKYDLGKNQVYIFDLSPYRIAYDLFLSGKYSQLPDIAKQAIVKYFRIGSAEAEYLDTFLYPENYYELYGQLMDVEVSILREVKELCNPFDPNKEKLIIY